MMQYPGNTVQEKYLWNLALTGMMEYHDYDPPKERIDRVKLEMDVIVGNGFTDYILMIWDIINFCDTPDRVFEFCEMKGLQPPPDGIIPTGPGRGSVGGSLVCFYIGIHKCDPIKFGLYFERFLNPERIAPPDYMIVEPCGNIWC